MTLQKLLDEIKRLNMIPKNIAIGYQNATIELKGIKETVEAVDNDIGLPTYCNEHKEKLWQQIKEELK